MFHYVHFLVIINLFLKCSVRNTIKKESIHFYCLAFNQHDYAVQRDRHNQHENKFWFDPPVRKVYKGKRIMICTYSQATETQNMKTCRIPCAQFCFSWITEFMHDNSTERACISSPLFLFECWKQLINRARYCINWVVCVSTVSLLISVVFHDEISFHVCLRCWESGVRGRGAWHWCQRSRVDRSFSEEWCNIG